MKVIIWIFKKLFLLVLALAILGLGAVLIFVERKTAAAEENVKTWKTSTCKVLNVEAGSDNDLYIQCQYVMNGQTYLVKNKTPSLNPYFNSVGSRDGKVVVTVIDSKKQGHFYEFRKGGTAQFWYQPSNPENSVLIPYAASLRPFFYLGIGYYVVIMLLLFFVRKNKKPGQ